MKKLLSFCGAAMAALFLCHTVQADSGHIVVDTYMPLNPVQSVSSTYSIRTDGINWASAQVVATSATVSTQTFTDGNASTGSFTVGSFAALSTTTAAGFYTVLFTTNLAGAFGYSTIALSSNVAGTVITITGPPAYTPGPFTIGGNVGFSNAFSSVTEQNFINAVNVSSASSGIIASSATNTNVQLSCASSGTFCNAYTILSSSVAAISSGTFANGVNPVSITFNSAVLTAGTQWQVGSSTSATALNIVNAFNTYIGSTTASVNPVVATSSFAVVFATAVVPGTLQNTYTLTTSNAGAISVSGASLTGGQDNAFVTVNGTKIAANVVSSTITGVYGFFPVTSNAQTATNLCAAMALSSGTTGVACTSGLGAVAVGTATVVGPAGNYVLTSSSNGALSLSGIVTLSGSAGSTSMTGGTNASYVVGTSTLTIPGAAFGTGQAVVLSTTSGNNLPLAPLAYGSTYYIINIPVSSSSNTFMLASASSNAVAGIPIVLVSSNSTAVGDIFKLTPLAITGTPAYQWVVSNDNSHWVPFTTNPFGVAMPGQIAMTTYYSSGTVNIWDFGHMDFSYLGLNVSAPTTGGVNISAHVIGNAP